MDIFLYIMIFLMGTCFGSFYSLATHRIPKKQDIIYTHSYCPNCNKKLGFFDLFPVFSYIFLKGKCRQCGKKISPRYIIFEICTGLIFATLAILLGYTIDTVSVITTLELVAVALYLTFIFLTIGINKETLKIEKSVNIYGITISILYILYLCLSGATIDIYRYGIYLILYAILMIIDHLNYKKYGTNSYTIGILLMIITMTIFTGALTVINSIILTLITISIYILLKRKIVKKDSKEEKETQINKKIPLAFYLGIMNIITLIVGLIYIYCI